MLYCYVMFVTLRSTLYYVMLLCYVMLCYEVAVIHLVEIYSMQVSMDFPFLAFFYY